MSDFFKLRIVMQMHECDMKITAAALRCKRISLVLTTLEMALDVLGFVLTLTIPWVPHPLRPTSLSERTKPDCGRKGWVEASSNCALATKLKNKGPLRSKNGALRCGGRKVRAVNPSINVEGHC